MKKNLKEKAIELRKMGLSYSNIRRQVKVSKSSLSLWLRSVGLSKRQKQKMTAKKLAAIRRGWEKWRKTRIDKTFLITNKAINEIGVIEKTDEKLWIMGIMLYWAEGAKTKEYDPGRGVSFSNSDPKMIRLFLVWLIKVLKINRERIKFDIYLHENKKNEVNEVSQFWSKITRFSIKKFDRIYYKKNKISSLRKNKGKNYHGLLRIQIKKSADLNRKISGWIEGVCQKWEIV